MYIYHETIDNCGVRLAWFTANGRSVHEVATLFQKGQLNREFIREVGDSLEVAFIDNYDHKMTPGHKYHLHLKPEKTNGYVRLVLYFGYGSFVGSWFRMQIDKIYTNTWRQLFPSRYLRKRPAQHTTYQLDMSAIKLRPQYLNKQEKQVVVEFQPISVKEPILLNEEDEYADYDSEVNVQSAPTPPLEPPLDSFVVEIDDFDDCATPVKEFTNDTIDLPPLVVMADPTVNTYPTLND